MLGVDLTRASVAITGLTTGSGISGAKMRSTVAHLPLTACYRMALRDRVSAPSLSAVLRLGIDINGRVITAQLSNEGDFAGLRLCIESAAIGAQVRDVDTGDGFAEINLVFSPL